MEKAYDLKDLARKIVAHADPGHVAEMAEAELEKIARAAYLGFKEWAKESAALSETKVDDFLAPFYDQADPFVLPQIEKIDLNKDGK